MKFLESTNDSFNYDYIEEVINRPVARFKLYDVKSILGSGFTAGSHENNTAAIRINGNVFNVFIKCK